MKYLKKTEMRLYCAIYNGKTMTFNFSVITPKKHKSFFTFLNTKYSRMIIKNTWAYVLIYSNHMHNQATLKTPMNLTGLRIKITLLTYLLTYFSLSIFRPIRAVI